MSARSLFPLLVVLAAVAASLYAGSIDPPAGPITATGRFGPRIDILSLPAGGGGTRAISQTGSYYLSGNLVVTSGDGIQVNAPDVVIDLNGFRVEGAGTGTGILHVNGGVVSGSIVVRNAEITGFSTGTLMNSGRLVRLEGIHSHDNTSHGINIDNGAGAAGKSVQIIDCAMTNNGGNGLFCTRSGMVRGCSAVANGVDGLFLLGGLVENCYARENAGTADIVVNNGLLRGCSAGSFLPQNGTTLVDNHTL